MTIPVPLSRVRLKWVVVLAGVGLTCVALCSLLDFVFGFSLAADPLKGATVPVKRIKSIPGTDDSVVWLDNYLVIQSSFDSLYHLDPDGKNLQKISLPDYPGCDRSIPESSTRLPDGRLAYIVNCVKHNIDINTCLKSPSNDINTIENCISRTSGHSYLVVLNADGKIEPLLNYPFPEDYPAYGYSWSPGMDRAITSYYDWTDGQVLLWLFRDHRQRVDVPYEPAILPRWSPDGASIAFVAFAGKNSAGVVINDLPLNLYIMDTKTSELVPLLHDIAPATDLAWSPDSKWLALSLFSQSARLPDRGLYLINIQTGNKVRITSEFACSLAWSPDGKQLAAIGYPPSSEYDSAPPCNALYIFDVAQIK